MSMSLRLSEDAVRGSKYQTSPEALEALKAGDTAALIRSHADRFGGWRMEQDDDEDDDDEDDNDDDSDGDDDDDDDDDDDSDDEDADEDGPEGKKSKKRKSSDEGEKDPKRKIAALEDEKNRLYRGRERARKERDELQKTVDRLKKDGVKDEDLQKENLDLTSKIEKSDKRLAEANLRIAFLSDNTYEWANPGLALKAADLSDLEIDDDGKVHGLKAALEALATENPFLLKQKTRQRSEPKDGPSGTPPARRRTSAAKQAAERKKIADKYGIRR